MKICYVGVGRLGLSLAAWSAHKGHNVICADVNPETVEAVNEGRSPISEPQVAELIAEHHGKNLAATIDTVGAVIKSDMSFVLVPTPSNDDGSFSIKHVLAACGDIGVGLAHKPDEYHVVVIVSTVMPGHTNGPISRKLETVTGRKIPLVYSPEFIRQGSIVRDFARPAQILIGESDERAGQVVEEYYRSIVENEPSFRRMSLVEAEWAKIGLNACIVQRMATSAQITWACQHTPGADSWNVLSSIASDPRIGSPYFERTLFAAGPCFPRDCRAFAVASEAVGVESTVAAAADVYLGIQADNLARLVQEHLVPGGTVGLLGLTYKAGTDITTESLALLLAERLFGAPVGARVLAYDPMAVVEPGHFERVELLDALVDRSDVLVLTVKWPQFRELEGMDLGGKTILDMWGFLANDRLNCGHYIRFGERSREGR